MVYSWLPAERKPRKFVKMSAGCFYLIVIMANKIRNVLRSWNFSFTKDLTRNYRNIFPFLQICKIFSKYYVSFFTFFGIGPGHLPAPGNQTENFQGEEEAEAAANPGGGGDSWLTVFPWGKSPTATSLLSPWSQSWSLESPWQTLSPRASLRRISPGAWKISGRGLSWWRLRKTSATPIFIQMHAN